MGKPILITEYPTVRDQIEDGITGELSLFQRGFTGYH